MIPYRIRLLQIKHFYNGSKFNSLQKPVSFSLNAFNCLLKFLHPLSDYWNSNIIFHRRIIIFSPLPHFTENNFYFLTHKYLLKIFLPFFTGHIIRIQPKMFSFFHTKVHSLSFSFGGKGSNYRPVTTCDCWTYKTGFQFL